MLNLINMKYIANVRPTLIIFSNQLFYMINKLKKYNVWNKSIVINRINVSTTRQFNNKEPGLYKRQRICIDDYSNNLLII